MVKKIASSEFSEVKKQPVALVDFSASWCGPCKMLAPVIEAVSEEMGDKVTFYNVDVDECQDIAREYNIMSVPTLILLKQGGKAAMHVGYAQEEEIVSFINGAI